MSRDNPRCNTYVTFETRARALLNNMLSELREWHEKTLEDSGLAIRGLEYHSIWAPRDACIVLGVKETSALATQFSAVHISMPIYETDVVHKVAHLQRLRVAFVGETEDDEKVTMLDDPYNCLGLVDFLYDSSYKDDEEDED